MTWFGFSVVAIAATEPMAYVQSIPEIIMYMQKFYEHLFLKTDEESGMKVVDEERLKKFATLLRDSVDKGLVVYVCVCLRVCVCACSVSLS